MHCTLYRVLVARARKVSKITVRRRLVRRRLALFFLPHLVGSLFLPSLNLFCQAWASISCYKHCKTWRITCGIDSDKEFPSYSHRCDPVRRSGDRHPLFDFQAPLSICLNHAPSVHVQLPQDQNISRSERIAHSLDFAHRVGLGEPCEEKRMWAGQRWGTRSEFTRHLCNT